MDERMNKKCLLYSILITGALLAGTLIYSHEPPLFGDDTSLANLQTKYEQSTEIKAKYDLEEASLVKREIKNAELDKYKNEPKDEISVRIGNYTTSEVLGGLEGDFEPTIELKRWNEVSFKLIPDLSAVKDRTLTFDKDKILFDTPKISFEMYDTEESYKYIWYLNEKPKSNVVSFEIETDGLDFFYQPELTQEEIDEGAYRPENVVGSYAVYHQTKGGLNDKDSKDYKVGKAFHIYRPKLIDAEGKETWGILKIENGIYLVEIPQEFLDKAVYPIKSNDTFGYESDGGTRDLFNDDLYGSIYSMSSDGDVSKLTAYIYVADSNEADIEGAVYDSSKNKEGDTQLISSPQFMTADWYDFSFTNDLSLTSGDYWLIIWGQYWGYLGGNGLYYDSGSTDQGAYQDVAKWPDPLSPDSYADKKYSIYATYTPREEAEEPTPKQDVIFFD
jgi:hypothetical protein